MKLSHGVSIKQSGKQQKNSVKIRIGNLCSSLKRNLKSNARTTATRIKNGNSAQYNSVQQFLAMMHSDNNYPADTNLFSIYIVPPSIL